MIVGFRCLSFMMVDFTCGRQSDSQVASGSLKHYQFAPFPVSSTVLSVFWSSVVDRICRWLTIAQQGIRYQILGSVRQKGFRVVRQRNIARLQPVLSVGKAHGVPVPLSRLTLRVKCLIRRSEPWVSPSSVE